MWDSKDGLPYGAIDNIEIKNKTAVIDFTMKSSGKIDIVAAKQIQEKLATLHSGEMNSGKHQIEVDVSHLPEEFHYLLFFYEGKLAHFQEMDLR
jgi:hypothetical protein